MDSKLLVPTIQCLIRVGCPKEPREDLLRRQLRVEMVQGSSLDACVPNLSVTKAHSHQWATPRKGPRWTSGVKNYSLHAPQFPHQYATHPLARPEHRPSDHPLQTGHSSPSSVLRMGWTCQGSRAGTECNSLTIAEYIVGLAHAVEFRCRCLVLVNLRVKLQSKLAIPAGRIHEYHYQPFYPCVLE